MDSQHHQRRQPGGLEPTAERQHLLEQVERDLEGVAQEHADANLGQDGDHQDLKPDGDEVGDDQRIDAVAVEDQGHGHTGIGHPGDKIGQRGQPQVSHRDEQVDEHGFGSAQEEIDITEQKEGRRLAGQLTGGVNVGADNGQDQKGQGTEDEASHKHPRGAHGDRAGHHGEVTLGVVAGGETGGHVPEARDEHLKVDGEVGHQGPDAVVGQPDPIDDEGRQERPDDHNADPAAEGERGVAGDPARLGQPPDAHRRIVRDPPRVVFLGVGPRCR